MSVIRPSADLRNNYNEISNICHATQQPVYITKNGYSDLVVMCNEAYEKLTEENIDKLVSAKFDEYFRNLEDFKKQLYEKLEKSLNEIKEGNGIPMGKAVAELEEKYGGDWNI